MVSTRKTGTFRENLNNLSLSKTYTTPPHMYVLTHEKSSGGLNPGLGLHHDAHGFCCVFCCNSTFSTFLLVSFAIMMYNNWINRYRSEELLWNGLLLRKPGNHGVWQQGGRSSFVQTARSTALKSSVIYGLFQRERQSRSTGGQKPQNNVIVSKLRNGDIHGQPNL